MSKLNNGIRVGAALTLAVVAASGCADDTGDPIASEDQIVSAATTLSGRYIVAFRAGGNGRAAVQAAGGQIALELAAQNAVAVRLPAAAVTALERYAAAELSVSSARLRIAVDNVASRGLAAALGYELAGPDEELCQGLATVSYIKSLASS